MNARRVSSPSHNAIDGTPTLPLKTDKVGRPRLDPYQRLLGRLYESVFLLAALGQTRAKHTPRPTDRNEPEACRRRLMQSLAYVLDFDKGGTSCTAIAIENANACYKFWIASNTEASAQRAAAFLRIILRFLKQDERPCEGEAELLRLCINFAKKRVTKDTAGLKNALRLCQVALKVRDSNADKKLSAWLESITVDGGDDLDQCHSAWTAAKSGYMRALTAEAKRQEQLRGVKDKQSPFAVAKHYIGRLVSRIGAVKLLLLDCSSVSHLLSSYDVCIVSPVTAVPPPQVDTHTTLHGILNRILKKGDPERGDIEEILIKMDRTTGIFRNFMLQYSRSNPMVHAEIQVLEHFFKEKLNFVDDDRYIACSKPACVCCKLYFQHHPARMVIPQSHEKVWPNWSPPLVHVFQKDDHESKRQRDILNSIIESLRTDAIAQVLNASQPPAWHADSQTGISAFDDCHSSESEYQWSESESARLLALPSDHLNFGENSGEGLRECSGNHLGGEDPDKDDKDGNGDEYDDDDEGGVLL